MNPHTLLQAMNDLPEDLLDEADVPLPRKKPVLFPRMIAAAAACAALALGLWSLNAANRNLAVDTPSASSETASAAASRNENPGASVSGSNETTADSTDSTSAAGSMLFPSASETGISGGANPASIPPTYSAAVPVPDVVPWQEQFWRKTGDTAPLQQLSYQGTVPIFDGWYCHLFASPLAPSALVAVISESSEAPSPALLTPKNAILFRPEE